MVKKQLLNKQKSIIAISSFAFLLNIIAVHPVEASVIPKSKPVDKNALEIKNTTFADKPVEEEDVLLQAQNLFKESEALNRKFALLNQNIAVEIEKIKTERLIEENIKEKNLNDFVDFANKYHFENYDIRTKSNLTSEQLEKVLKGTGLEGLGTAYEEAEKTSGVSSFVLIGMSALESGWGTSEYAQTKNNLFGYGAYDRNPDLAKDFDTKEESILFVAADLATYYLNPKGMFFNGYTLEAVNKRYSSDKEWHNKITQAMNEMILKLSQ